MRNVLIGLLLMISPANAFTIDPVEALTNEKTCMKLNLYHESRGEKMRGIIEVMKVTLARVRSPEFPDTVCDVVWQQWPVEQFSWTNDHLPDNEVTDTAAWKKIDMLVDFYYNGKLHLEINPEVKYYHAGPVTRFFRKLEFVKKIGGHSFYRE